MKNDFEIKWMPEYLREIHCVRRIITEETTGMDEDEIIQRRHKAAENLFDELGFPPPKIVSFAHEEDAVLNK
jgi:hypothetical protein